MTREELLDWCCKQNCKLPYSNCDLCMYNKGKADALDKCLSAIEHCVTGSECRELLEGLKEQSDG